jgi:hypothetical protein
MWYEGYITSVAAEVNGPGPASDGRGRVLGEHCWELHYWYVPPFPILSSLPLIPLIPLIPATPSPRTFHYSFPFPFPFPIVSPPLLLFFLHFPLSQD